jgi:hypothetical protein
MWKMLERNEMKIDLAKEYEKARLSLERKKGEFSAAKAALKELLGSDDLETAERELERRIAERDILQTKYQEKYDAFCTKYQDRLSVS